MKKKNENKNKENIDIEKITSIKRKIIDKTGINNLLIKKSYKTTEKYFKKYSNMKTFKNENNKEIENLKDIIDLQKKENKKLQEGNEKLEFDYELEKKKKVELINRNSKIKRIRKK